MHLYYNTTILLNTITMRLNINILIWILFLIMLK